MKRTLTKLYRWWVRRRKITNNLHSIYFKWNLSTGLLCCFVTVIFFAAPLTMLLHVIKIKNAESLPFPLIVSNFFVSLEWFVYGCLIKDPFLQVIDFVKTIATRIMVLYTTWRLSNKKDTNFVNLFSCYRLLISSDVSYLGYSFFCSLYTRVE